MSSPESVLDETDAIFVKLGEAVAGRELTQVAEARK